jgi:hypothetical protein
MKSLITGKWKSRKSQGLWATWTHFTSYRLPTSCNSHSRKQTKTILKALIEKSQ